MDEGKGELIMKINERICFLSSSSLYGTTRLHTPYVEPQYVKYTLTANNPGDILSFVRLDPFWLLSRCFSHIIGTTFPFSFSAAEIMVY
jgi:hypothetical protein